MTTKQQIIDILVDYEKKLDINHWIRRFFRCFIDGSYLGEEHYKTNIAYIKQNKNKEKKMKRFVINQFTAFIAKEFGCSYSYAQKSIIKSGVDLDRLNASLIDDALDLID